MIRLFRLFPLTICLILLGWIGGFLLFVTDISTQIEPTVTNDLTVTDAIVVLTGGSERLTTGIELLESGRGKKLFISGVHKGLSLDELLGGQPVPADLRACCIALGYQAGSTIGNAEETQEWMAIENYHSLRLVTANYHMPRSLLLFHVLMPDVEIIPHPIAPDSVKLGDLWQHPGTAELLFTEYNKLLLANVKIWVELK